MATKVLNAIPYSALDKLLNLGLEEDIGTGDITSMATIPEDQISTAVYVAKESGIAAGLPLIDHLIRKTSPGLSHSLFISEGDAILPGTSMGSLSGSTRKILAIERLMLNFLQHFCGIASKTHSFTLLIKDSKTKILDTRKTLPGFRALDKYAVKIGGGSNHRMGLFDRVLIKDNHIQACGSVRNAVDKTSLKYGDKFILEAEVSTLSELTSLKGSKVNWIMLDNMSKDVMMEAIAWTRSNMELVKLEASGNMDLRKVKEISNIGLDYISVGALTHSFDALDITLKFNSST